MRRDIIIHDPDYLQFIRTKPCCVCGNPGVDSDHLVHQGWRGAKRNDLTAIPMCREDHTARHKIGTDGINEKYGVNLWREAAWLLIEYFQEIKNGQS